MEMSTNKKILYPLIYDPKDTSTPHLPHSSFSCSIRTCKNPLFLSKNPNRSNQEKVISYVKVEIVYVMWQVRPKNEVLEVSSMYAGAPTWFSIKLHHDGKITKLPDIKYIGGEVRYIDYVDIYGFSVHELDAIMLDLSYPDPQMTEVVDVSDSPVIYYHFKIVNGDFQFGLRALGNDHDVINI
ncbi:unnamed protein product [Lactuca saligna]|uniref:PB1-like domain-containing protein n=1 Tax=Lactuca saligna TaxID=75948 RepID=A0AA35V6B5_LACSI|nr:unnamed protein product [Lactuca saligna]